MYIDWNRLVLITLKIFGSMPAKSAYPLDIAQFRSEVFEHSNEVGGLPGWMFRGLLIYVDSQCVNGATSSSQDGMESRLKQACITTRFAGGMVATNLEEGVTHVLVGHGKHRVKDLRKKISGFAGPLPRIVTANWVENSWREGTWLDEESESYRV